MANAGPDEGEVDEGEVNDDDKIRSVKVIANRGVLFFMESYEIVFYLNSSYYFYLMKIFDCIIMSTGNLFLKKIISYEEFIKKVIS